MGFFSNLFRGRDAPSNSTAGSGYGFFMGSTASGKRVNARSAMQMGSMTRSILTLGSYDKEKESLEIPNVLRQSMQLIAA
ncbi:MAG: hypothetical protein U0M65_09400, partial [Blautia obeum]